MESTESDEEMWDDDEEEEMLSGPVTCLFCESVFQSVVTVFEHCKGSHQFDIHSLARKLRLDCFSYIKMINYIRKQKASSSAVSEAVPPFPWQSDEFMQPADANDLLLLYDVESHDSSEFDHPPGNERVEASEEGEPSSSPVGGAECVAAAVAARSKQAEEELQRALQELEKIRSFMGTLMASDTNVPLPKDTSTVQSLSAQEDEAYFGSYSHFSIHQEMLKDKVRTESYRDLMLKNKELFTGKVVLDVGCGTGILSMFAARAGADQVIGVDQSDIIYQAMDIVRENGLSEKITLVKGRLEDIELPVEKVDIIISEWMGYFLLFESMLDTVLYARDRYLAENGIVFPDRCNISVVGSGDLDLFENHVSFWNDVYGFKMSCLKAEVIHEANVELVNNTKCITHPSVIKDLDVCRCRINDLQFETPFCLSVIQDGCLTAVVGYFDIFFERGCQNKVSFSTGPGSPATHWKQTVFLLDKPRPVKQGEKLEGTISCRKNRKDPRSLVITIQLAGEKYKYIME